MGAEKGAEKIYLEIAEEYGITVEEVKAEIQSGINDAYKHVVSVKAEEENGKKVQNVKPPSVEEFLGKTLK